MKSFLWYTDAKLPEERQWELEQVLAKYLSEEEKGDIMRTVAQKYIEEGETRGIQIGEAKGEIKKAIAIAKNLLKENAPIEYVSKITGLSMCVQLRLVCSVGDRPTRVKVRAL